ncbi:ABC transporter permease [Zavarzinia sp. CC-PAN008]|uniref:ABC transporter permease n=1 Tax=Zavarzinia sp. CC-PAN008 TaxID=3243332 RepID=UPI003F747AAC
MRLINRRPTPASAALLTILPFAAVVLAYAVASGMRLAENPADKVLPGFGTIWDAIVRYAVVEDPRTGDLILWVDTLASLARLLGSLAISTLSAVVLGVTIGLLPHMRALLGPFMAVLATVPPLALLPILFIMFGLGEVAKVVLIVIGVAPFLIRDVAMRVQELPVEQLIKAQTLGGSTWQIVLRVVLPQVLPRLIDAVRLSLGAAWLFLIAAEAIASESGLGFRIFLVRRYLAMDVILPYVAWITILAFTMDWLLKVLQGRLFPWFAAARAQ